MKPVAIAMTGLASLVFSYTASAETLSDALLSCAKEKNSLQRLVCYDHLAKNFKQFDNVNEKVEQYRGNNTGKPESVSVPEIAPSRATPEIEFGFENKPKNEEREDTLYGTVVDVDQDARDNQLVTLDNGTVWKQSESSFLVLRKDDMVEIKRGALGSFFIAKQGANKRMRVKRVK